MKINKVNKANLDSPTEKVKANVRLIQRNSLFSLLEAKRYLASLG